MAPTTSSTKTSNPVTTHDPSLGQASTPSDKGKIVGTEQGSSKVGVNNTPVGAGSTPSQGQNGGVERNTKFASGNGLVPTTSSPSPSAPAEAVGVDDGDKDKGSLSTTLAGTLKDAETRPKANKFSTSDSTGEKPKTSSSNPSKNKKSLTTGSSSSFLIRLLRKLVPCLGPSSAHLTVLEDTGSDRKSSMVLQEKQVPKDSETVIPTEPSVPSTSQTTPTTITIPPATQDPQVILPPTPTKLLPQAETEGVTSGAVQPPGSKGDQGLPAHPRTETHESGEESDGTSYTEDDDVDEHIDDPEDDEERLILNGGAGIPIIDGVPRPLLPPLTPQHKGRKCLVLDLDETLVHSSFKSIQQADYVVPVEIEYHWHNVYVIKRPGVDSFLKKMGEIYEIVVFTASLSKYADPVLDKLDINNVVSHRLFRESCYNHKGNYVKDLSQLGRPIADTIILDNSPASYIFHPNNAVPVSSWFNDPHDTELTDLCPFLADLATVNDVQGILDGGL